MSYIDLLVNIIIQQYFISSRCIIILTDNNNKFNYQLNIPQVNIQISDANFSEKVFNSFGCQGIIVKSNDPEMTLTLFEQELRWKSERLNQRKYIVLPGNHSNYTVNSIFEQTAIKFVSDLIALEVSGTEVHKNQLYLNTDDIECRIWTHNYVSSSPNEIYILDKWFSKNQSFLLGTNLFPNKLLNQMGRMVKVATINYEPYATFEVNPNGTYTNIMGSELTVLVHFAKHYNISIDFVVPEAGTWGVVWENGSGDGIMGNVISDRADLGAGALYQWLQGYAFMDFSKPTVRAGVTCLVPAPRLAAGWLTPFYSFSLGMWAAVIITFLVCITVNFSMDLYYIRKHQFFNNWDKSEPMSVVDIFDNSLQNIGKIFVQQNITERHIPNTKPILKIFTGLIFGFGLLLDSSFSSGYSTIMTVPRYEGAINTVDDFLNSGIPWGAPQNDGWIESLQESKQPVYEKLAKRFKTATEAELKVYSKTRNFAFAIEKLPQDTFAVGSYIENDAIQGLRLMQEDFYWEQCIIMLRKSSILLPMVDMFILRTFEAGLIHKWQNIAVNKYMNTYIQSVVRYYSHNDEDKKPVKLKLIQVEGAFAILLFGLLLSLIVFSIELLIYKSNKTRNIGTLYNNILI